MNLPTFGARSLAYVIDAYAHFPDDPASGLVGLLEIDQPTAERLIQGAMILSMVSSDGTVAELAALIREANVVERREIVRYYLERFEPYADWKRRVAQGFDPLDAARQAKAIHSIDETPATIRDWFLDLGLYCGSLMEEPSSVVPVTGSTPSLGSLVSSLLSGRESNVQVLGDYLGQQLWRKLPDPVKEHLTVALGKLASAEAADEAVREAGMAMDKYMMDLGESTTGTPYGGGTMGTTAKSLRTAGLLVEKQEGFTAYGVKLRNAAEHPDTDADLGGERWVISGKGALTYLRVVLDFMRSANSKLDGRYEI